MSDTDNALSTAIDLMSRRVDGDIEDAAAILETLGRYLHELDLSDPRNVMRAAASAAGDAQRAHNLTKRASARSEGLSMLRAVKTSDAA